ncbi:hypothetical protein CEXT_641401 [Caerostris extrusa]|uniref:Uncharacterized protein n=1 Tax=Caerostris extrusa TaxID=172846 RepID=A0AAV4QSD1_CAEEX|nr:hypothetical protein CEXT_641401 [Caerostris extrusa]
MVPKACRVLRLWYQKAKTMAKVRPKPIDHQATFGKENLWESKVNFLTCGVSGSPFFKRSLTKSSCEYGEGEEDIFLNWKVLPSSFRRRSGVCG